MLNRWFIPPLIVLAVIWCLLSLSVRRPAGIACPFPPIQTATAEDSWKRQGFTLTALAEYDIHACVLGKENYTLGREAALSPVDLALGWGPMSDQAIIDQISCSQGNRFFHWNTRRADILDVERLEISASNVHIIPANERIRERILRDFHPGQIVRLKGKLVHVTAEDGWSWVSSLSRLDTGRGACEILWVEECLILEG